MVPFAIFSYSSSVSNQFSIEFSHKCNFREQKSTFSNTETNSFVLVFLNFWSNEFGSKMELVQWPKPKQSIFENQRINSNKMIPTRSKNGHSFSAIAVFQRTLYIWNTVYVPESNVDYQVWSRNWGWYLKWRLLVSCPQRPSNAASNVKRWILDCLDNHFLRHQKQQT